MNGVRAIFLRELRAGLVPDILILVLCLATFTAVERALMAGGELREDIGQGIDLVLFGCAAFLSFASGARTFPREVKARRVLSLYTLPISRGALWGALVGGRFTAVTAALAGLCLARLSILRTLGQADPALGSLIPLLALIPVLFMAGVCSSLTFESNSPVYLIGYPVAIFSVLQALGLANAGFSSWRPSGFAAWLWTLALVFIFLVFLALSWRFFQLGDFPVRRRSLTKQTLLAASLLCAFGIIGTVTHSPLLASRWGPWKQDDLRSFRSYWQYGKARPASPGGLYLAVAERLTNRPDHSRLSIVETTSGRIIATRTWSDLRWASWSGHEQVLHLLVRNHWAPEPWRSLLGPQNTWIRLSPEGKELSRSRLGSIAEFAPLPNGTDLITIFSEASDGVHQLLSLQNRSAPLVIEEVPASRSLSSVKFHRHSRGVIVFDALGSRWRAENRKVRKINLSEPDSGPPAEIVLRRQKDMTTLALWTRSSKAPEWERRATGLTLIAVPKDSGWLSPFFVRNDQRPSISPPEGLTVYLPTGGQDGLASLYDGTLDREIPLPACTDSRAAFPELIAAQSGPPFLVRFQCHGPMSPGETVRVRHFYYLPGSGAVKPLPDFDRVMTKEPVLLAYLDETSAIWRSKDSATWSALRDGKLRNLWPARP